MALDEQGASWALDLTADTVIGEFTDVFIVRVCACDTSNEARDWKTGVLGVVDVARVVADVLGGSVVFCSMELRVAGGPTITDVAAREGREVLGEVATGSGAFATATITDIGVCTDWQVTVAAFVVREGRQVAKGATAQGV